MLRQHFKIIQQKIDFGPMDWTSYIAKAEQRTLTTVSQNYPNNTTFNNTIADTKQELNNSIATKLSSSTFNTFVAQYNADHANLVAADKNNTQAIADTNTRVDEAFNQLSNHNSRITTNTNNITNLNNTLNNKIQCITDESQATTDNTLYFIY